MSRLVLGNAEQSVSCISNCAPYMHEAMELINYFNNSFSSDFSRVFVCSSLFHKTESMLLKENSLKAEDYTSILKSALGLAKKIDMEMNEWKDLNLESIDSRVNSFTLEEATQNHYGDLFSDFDNEYYFNTPTELLKLRFARNDIDYGFLAGSRALDCGCGNGRYSNALINLGCQEVYGIDFSPKNIKTAQRYLDIKTGMNPSSLNLHYLEGDVLQIPFEDNYFDFVFSNGVLHHTRSILQGIREIYRVLKHGGKSWFYVLGKPCGIRMDSVEISRYIMKDVNPKYSIKLLSDLGMTRKKILYMLDHIFVPINTLSNATDFEIILEEQGFKKIKRLYRGADNDAIEIKSRNQQMNKRDMSWIFGEPELRYLMEK